MNDVMTQGFEELNENDLEMVDGGVDWWGVAKGLGQGLWGDVALIGGSVYGCVTGNWNGAYYGYKQVYSGAKKITYAILTK